MSFEVMVGNGAVQALGWTLLHFLWQGAVVAALLALADTLAARRSAELRYALAVAALALMVASPLLTFAALRTGHGPEGLTSGPGPLLATAGGAAATWGAGDAVAGGLRGRLAAALPMLVAAWGLGVLVLSVRMAGGWLVARRLARSGRPAAADGLERALARLSAAMRVWRPVRLLESARVEVPTVVGWLRPVILFPAATLAGLSPAQLEVVLAHELAHVRRLDYLVNLLQTAVETLLFYHPGVWWVSQRVRVEREHCCDDAAVAACGDAVAYARALTELEGLRIGATGLAMAADGGSLLGRVRRLVGGPAAHRPRAVRALGGVLAILAVPVLFAGSGLLEAKAQSAREAAPAAQVAPAEMPAAEAKLTLAEVIELAQSGVTPEYLDEMAAAGYPSLSWRKLAELRSHGVDATFVKGLRAHGLDRLSVSDLIELRSQGVTPDYVAELKAAGYDKLSANALMSLRGQGVTGEFARELRSLGYEGLSTTKLMALRSEGVTPEYVRGLKDLGYTGVSVPVLHALRSQGVTPEYVRELKEAGYAGLSTGMLIELRAQGVTPEFVRELKDAGWGDLKPEELIELRSRGVRGDLLRRLRQGGRTGQQ